MKHLDPTTYSRLYTVDRSVRTVMNVCAVVWLVTLLATVLPTPFRRPLAYASFITLGLLILLAVVRLCLSPFVKSDEEEEMEQKVEYILKQYQAREQQSMIEDYSPLCNLTDEQRQRVKQLLRDLQPQPDKPDHINLAVVAQHLTALKELHKADLEDKRNLRLWVAQVTGKKVQSPSQFNEAIPSTNKKKVAAACKTIEQIMQ